MHVSWMLAFFILSSILCYYVFIKDIFSPSVIYNLSWSLSCVLLLLMGVEEAEYLAYNTAKLIIYSSLLFDFISFFVLKLPNIKKIKVNKPLRVLDNENEIYIRKYTILIVLIFYIIFFAIIFNDIYFVTKQNLSFGSFSKILQLYRRISTYTVEGYYLSSAWVVRFSKISYSVSLIFIYIFLYNHINFGINNLQQIIPLLFHSIISLCRSNRGDLLYLFIAIIAMYAYLSRDKSKQYRTFSFSEIIKLLIIIILVLVSFYNLRLLVGRFSDSEASISYYLGMYAGAPMKLFDLFLQNPISSDIPGKETFFNLIQSLVKRNIISYKHYIIHKEFRYLSGYNLGNVYTALRSWYADFGYCGIFVLQSIFSAYFSIMHKHILRLHRKKNMLSLLIFACLYYSLPFHPIDSLFYRNILNTSFIINLGCFIILPLFMIKNKTIIFRSLRRK
jgi:oligosaccharide repeat unit polymerase